MLALTDGDVQKPMGCVTVKTSLFTPSAALEKKRSQGTLVISTDLFMGNNTVKINQPYCHHDTKRVKASV